MPKTRAWHRSRLPGFSVAFRPIGGEGGAQHLLPQAPGLGLHADPGDSVPSRAHRPFCAGLPAANCLRNSGQSWMPRASRPILPTPQTSKPRQRWLPNLEGRGLPGHIQPHKTSLAHEGEGAVATSLEAAQEQAARPQP